MTVSFGNLGVCVEGYTEESLYALLKEHGLDGLVDERYLIASNPYNQNTYLQSEFIGPYIEGNTITINSCFIPFVTDMDTFLLILRTGILNADAANSLVDELYSQGLIKPRNYNE